MTEQVAPQLTEEEAQQVTMMRQSLLTSVFQQYNQLTKMIRSLPIPAEIPGIFKGLSYLEDGMLWIKEVLIACPIQIPAAPEKKDEAAPSSENEPKQPELLEGSIEPDNLV